MVVPGIHACGRRGVLARASLYAHLTEKRLPPNLAVLGSEVTLAIKHGDNDLSFIIVSRKNVLYLNIIEINRDTFATGFDALARIVFKEL